MASLILSDGNRTIDLVGTPPDGIYLVEFSPPVVSTVDTFASGADSEGAMRVRSVAQNPSGDGLLRIDRVDGTAADFWDDVDDLQDLVAAAHRNRGTLEFTPPDGETVTFDLESCRISGLPTRGARLRRRICEPAFEFTCQPYGRLTPVTVFTGQTLSGPVGSIELGASTIPGHVDALAELTITAPAQNIDHLEFGLEQDGYDSASPAPLIVDSDSMTVLAGAQATQSGSYDPNATGNNVISCTLTSTPVAICTTGAQPHVGRKRLRLSVYGSATTARLRVSWRVGDGGKWTPTRWVTLPLINDFVDLDLEAITIKQVPSGTHQVEFRIEGYATSGTPTIKIDFLEILPAEVYGKARAPLAAPSPTAFQARDEFDQSAGALAGKSLPIGGTWSGAGDTDDFAVEATGHTLQRTALSDAATNITAGRFAIASAAAITDQVVRASLMASVSPTDFLSLVGQKFGVVARYTDTSNFAYALIWLPAKRLQVGYLATAGGATLADINLAKVPVGLSSEITLVITATGVWKVYVDGVAVGGGQAAALATGGGLASGKSGLLDYFPGNTATTRTFDNFAAWVPDLDHVLFSGRKAKVFSTSVQRQNSGGTRYGKVPAFEGHYLKIPPSTKAGLKSRLWVKPRRLDVDGGLPRQGLTDNVTADLVVTPRVALL